MVRLRAWLLAALIVFCAPVMAGELARLSAAGSRVIEVADQLYLSVQNCLGIGYMSGTGLPQDDAQAVSWFQEAAERGYAPAQRNLGWMYQVGRGVPQDDMQAISWYRMAADQDDADAQSAIGW